MMQIAEHHAAWTNEIWHMHYSSAKPIVDKSMRCVKISLRTIQHIITIDLIELSNKNIDHWTYFDAVILIWFIKYMLDM